MTGYYEADCLGTGGYFRTTGRATRSVPAAEVWGRAAFDNGWTFVGGQREPGNGDAKIITNNTEWIGRD